MHRDHACCYVALYSARLTCRETIRQVTLGTVLTKGKGDPAVPFACVTDPTMLLDETCVLVRNDATKLAGTERVVRVIVEHCTDDRQTKVNARHRVSSPIQR